ncbi:MAG TPA: DUF5672 family protein [Lysobacter sp.]
MTRPKLDLRTVSLVCIETRRPQLAVYAIERCLQQADFGECLLLSPNRVELPPSIRHVEIPDITSVAGYSEFMIRHLGRHFSGSHALIVQWDGFITDAHRWDARFLDYDYIGAPWYHRPVAVGNGGFSLRSRRLVDALQAMDTPVTHPEDQVICERYRPELEQRFGVRFAPLELASRFAWEQNEPADGTFGFHAFFNFHRALSEAELLDYLDLCDRPLLHSVPARRLLKNLYRASMHTAARKLSAARMTGPLSMQLDALKLRLFATLRR